MGTREQLLHSAERLFAANGIAEVSLRQISADAGQRNTAAAHYHFGDKRTLLREILRSRLNVIERRRRELLGAALAQADGVEGDGAEGDGIDVWPLVEALVRPLAEQAAMPDSHYVRFLYRLFGHLGDGVAALGELGGFEEAFAVAQAVVGRLPRFTAAQAQARARWAGRLIISALAELEADLEAERQQAVQAGSQVTPRSGPTEGEPVTKIATAGASGQPTVLVALSEDRTLALIDAVTGLLTAPPTRPRA